MPLFLNKKYCYFYVPFCNKRESSAQGARTTTVPTTLSRVSTQRFDWLARNSIGVFVYVCVSRGFFHNSQLHFVCARVRQKHFQALVGRLAFAYGQASFQIFFFYIGGRRTSSCALRTFGNRSVAIDELCPSRLPLLDTPRDAANVQQTKRDRKCTLRCFSFLERAYATPMFLKQKTKFVFFCLFFPYVLAYLDFLCDVKSKNNIVVRFFFLSDYTTKCRVALKHRARSKDCGCFLGTLVAFARSRSDS